MTAQDFLELLEAQNLLSRKVLDKLRRQVESTSRRVSPESLSRALVKKGLLTKEKAAQLLQQLHQREAAATEDEEELGLAPDDDLPAVRPAPQRPPKSPAPSADELEPAPSESEFEPEPEPIFGEPDDAAPVAELDHDEPTAEIDHDVLAEPEAENTASGAVQPRRRGWAGWFGGARAAKQPRKYSPNRWDSPLMLVGGGALLLLTMVVIGLYFYLSHGTGDDAFNLAYDDYRSGSYGQAIGKFEQFLDDYPDHPKAGMARVRIGLAEIWNVVTRKQWEEALATVRAELPKIEGLPEFNEARPELASLLPEIADGFAEQALKAPDIPGAEKYRALSQEALEEVNNSTYLPTSVRRGQQPRIEQILAKLQSVERRINRDRELEETIKQIEAVVAQGQTGQAYDLQRQLLRKYPGLELDDRLRTAVLTITQRERDAIQLLSEPPQPVTEEPQTSAQFRIALADCRGPTVAEADPEMVFVNARGAAYGLQSASGRLVWRRFLGFESNLPPIALSSEADAAVLLADARSDELICVDGPTGKLVWRLKAGGALPLPVLAGGRIFASAGDAEQGRLLVIDPATGTVERAATFPEPLTTTPLVDLPSSTLAQPGWQSSLYLLNPADLSCRDVFYLGHAAGSVVVPPVTVLGQILVAENPGPDFSLLHLLGPNPEQPDQLRRVVVDPLRLEGRVIVPMIAFGQRVLVVTDRGRLYVFEIDPNSADQPIRIAATAVSTVESGTTCFPFLSESRLWLGDRQLTEYELQVSRGQLVRKWIDCKGDQFLMPLQRKGNRLYSVRSRSGRAGVTVAATTVGGRTSDREGELLWETDLGVPPAGPPTINRAAQQIQVVSGNAALYSIDTQTIRVGHTDRPVFALRDPRLPPLQQALPVSSSEYVYLGSAMRDQVVVFAPEQSQQPLRLVSLILDGDTPAALPAAFQGGLLVPTRGGRVELLDVEMGRPAAEPFQPSLSAGADVKWQSPAITPDGEQAVLIDGKGTLYRLNLKTEPQPHLAAVLQEASSAEPIAPPVVVGSTVYLATRGVGSDRILSIGVDDFQPTGEWGLSGRCVWGPYAVGDLVLIATDGEELIALQSQQAEPRWKIPLPFGPLIGEPLVLGSDPVLASLRGTIWQLNRETGEEVARAEVDEPIGSGPVQFANNRLLVCGDDGTVHVLNFPTR